MTSYLTVSFHSGCTILKVHTLNNCVLSKPSFNGNQCFLHIPFPFVKLVFFSLLPLSFLVIFKDIQLNGEERTSIVMEVKRA